MIKQQTRRMINYEVVDGSTHIVFLNCEHLYLVIERARDEVQVRRLIAALSEAEGCVLGGGSVTSIDG